MKENKILEYAQQFDAYCASSKRKSTIRQEYRAIVWRMAYIILVIGWGIENPSYDDIDKIFNKELTFPYNDNSLKKFIDDSYEYEIFDEDLDEVLGDETEKKELQLEFNSYISHFENMEDVEWFKTYCDQRNINCTIDDETIAKIVSENLFDLVQTYGLSKRKEFELMDKIFEIVTFPNNQENYKKFIDQLNTDEILEKLEEL